MTRWAWLSIVLAPVAGASCVYDPKPQPGLPCSGTQQCPEGQMCDLPSNTCVLTPPDVDAPPGGEDGRPDAEQPVDCSGSFGSERLILDDTLGRISSPAVTGDERELFYVRDTGGTFRIFGSTRGTTTAMFPTGSEVDELNAVCVGGESRTVDVSYDGLRAYVICSPSGSSGPFPLHLFTRSSRTAAFEDQGTIGLQGFSAAPTRDELGVFSSGSSILYAERASTSADFPTGQAIPELTGMTLNAPSLAADDRTLFTGGLPDNRIKIYERPDPASPFAFVEDAPRPFTDGTGSPEISRDCRSLYFVGLPSVTMQQLYVMQR